MTKGLLAVVACLFVAYVDAAPIDDLGSPSQEVRDKAAQILKVSFAPTPRSQWEPVVAALKPGDSRDAVLQALSPYGVSSHQGRVAGGVTSTESYRLDDVWVLSCSYGRSNQLFLTNLHEQLRHVWVAPASDFSGVWTTYFANGWRSREIHYRNGSRFGLFTTFRPDGSKLTVQRYGPEGAEGEATAYFPSGALMYRGQHRNNAQVGTWVWFNEDGSVRSTREHPDSDEASREPE